MRSVFLFFRWGAPATILGTVTIGVIRLSQVTVDDALISQVTVGGALIGSVLIGVEP